jgi:hypothetical protein
MLIQPKRYGFERCGFDGPPSFCVCDDRSWPSVRFQPPLSKMVCVLPGAAREYFLNDAVV